MTWILETAIPPRPCASIGCERLSFMLMLVSGPEHSIVYGACADHYASAMIKEDRDRRYNTSPKGQARTQKAESSQYRKGYRAGYKAGSRAVRKPQEHPPTST